VRQTHQSYSYPAPALAQRKATPSSEDKSISSASDESECHAKLLLALNLLDRSAYGGTSMGERVSAIRQELENAPRPRDVLLSAAGALDQAVLSILHFRRGALDEEPPRSSFYDIVRAYHMLRTKTTLNSQARFVIAAGTIAFTMFNDWRKVRQGNESRFPRYYRMASLAAASALVPWMILRKA
jgi:hypothetical protein